MSTFNDLGVPARIVSALAARQITEAFPIQEASIPDLLEGRDVLGRAPTGSGKTLAFGIPMLARVEKAQPKLPRALVLAPTRELAEQISKELTPLAKAMQRYVIAIYGGVGYDFQRKNLRRGSDIVVATPGRLTDLIDEGTVSLADVDIVVIDEADRMADMGFMPQVRKLLDMTADNRQTVLFSATLDGDVADLTRRYQTDPVKHEVEGDDNASDAAHYFWRTHTHDRVTRTAEIIGTSTPSIVFTRTRRGADRVADQLEKAGVPAAAIHGGRSQNQRTRALQQFSRGRVKALVATDVAARGIHVDGVNSVIHYDLPEDPKDYLHRSGRTARAGADGVVVSLVLPEQVSEVNRIQMSVGLHTEIHSPDDDWLTGESGGRIGETPVVEVKGGARRRPQSNRGGGGGGRSGGGRSGAGGGRSGGSGRSGGRAGGRDATRGRDGGDSSRSRDGGDRTGHGRRSDGRDGPNENLYTEQGDRPKSSESRSDSGRNRSGQNRSNQANNSNGGRSNGNRTENGSDRDGNRRSENSDFDGNRSGGNSQGRSNGYRGKNTSGGNSDGNSSDGNRSSEGNSRDRQGNGGKRNARSGGPRSGGGYRGSASGGGNGSRRSH